MTHRSVRLRLAAFAATALSTAGMLGGMAASASASPVARPATPVTPVTLGIHDGAINQCISAENAARHGKGWGATQKIALTPAAKAAAVSSFTNPNWAPLKVGTVRFLAPWDIAHHDDGNKAGDHQLAVMESCMDAWLTGASTVGAWPEIDLRVDPNYKRAGRITAPGIGTYRQAVNAFTAKYSNAASTGTRARVRILVPWNEPDIPGAGAKRIYMPAGGRAMADPHCGGAANTCGPVLAARMWQVAHASCPSCVVVAGDFSGWDGISGPETGFFNVYRAHLGKDHPAVWALHPYTDVESFENYRAAHKFGHPALGKTLVARFAADLNKAGYHRNTQIWFNEISAFQGHNQAGASKPRWTPSVQYDAGKYLLGTLPRAASKPGDPTVTRVYYLNFQSHDPTNARWALVVNGTPQPIWSAFANR